VGDLVLDVGMHNGDDTAYYLARGYDVVAVEANPALCASAWKRFAPEVAAGRLSIRNVGIAEVAGEFEFWVSDYSEWSSFHRENATKGGAQALRISVPTVRFADLLSELPTPAYVKIDIEMNDSLCLRELQRSSSVPRYVSFEGHLGAAADIQFLSHLGYGAFKCVRQNDWREITPRNVVWHGAVRKAILGSRPRSRVLAAGLYRLHYRSRSVGGWRFPAGSSGPLGRELPGRWLACDEVLDVWQHLLAIDRELDAAGLGEWFDIHAAAGLPAGPATAPGTGYRAHLATGQAQIARLRAKND
jgi:FkbM family methyltransferase